MYNVFLKTLDIIKSAGDILKTDFYKPKEISTKSVAFDLVTETDKKIENFLIENFQKLMPNSKFLAEESDPSIKEADQLWIIDPIDGTTNFVHQFPFVCISVAFSLKGSLIFGIVYNPIMQEFYSTYKGKGAFLNNVPIHVSLTDNLAHAFLGTGFAYNIGTANEDNIDIFKKMITKVHGIRRPGSAALDLCYVARGIYDAFWEWYLNPWDVSAGILLIQEAGGTISNLNGEDWKMGDISIVASNTILHNTLLKSLNE